MMRSVDVRLAVLVLIAVLRSATLIAQDQPVVFVHGLNSSAERWEAAASRLANRLEIQPLAKSTDSHATLESQSGDLQGQISDLPNSLIAIGHSNGGLVSRHLSTRRGVNGIVTLGTPNQGAPLALNLTKWVGFNLRLFGLLGNVSAAFLTPFEEWRWVNFLIFPALDFSARLAASVVQIGTNVGLELGTPVLQEMGPGSSFLASLNGTANLARESASIPARVGIQSGHPSYVRGGPWVLSSPEHADEYSVLMAAASSVLRYWGNSILGGAQYDPNNPGAYDDAVGKAYAILDVASWLEFYELFWCEAISSPTMSSCLLSDGVVPWDSQKYPGAAPIEWLGGPVHTQETAESDDKLFEVLTTFMHVPPRGAGGGTGGGTGTGGGSGGNGDGGGGTGSGGDSGGAPIYDNTLDPGETLETLSSDDGRFQFVYQGDSNVVLYAPTGEPLWSSNTTGATLGQAVMQGDGNFVVYNSAGQPVWASGTQGNSGARLVVQGDGNVVIYSGEGVPLWSTGTVQP